MILFLRGKAATGKSMIADELGRVKGIPVIRKDDMFDILLNNKIDRELANSISYDIMISTIQKHIDVNSDVIVDIGLSHTPSFKMFLDKLNFVGVKTKYVLCDCKNQEVWNKRIEARVINPNSNPNQFFKSVEEAINHYSKHSIIPLEGEIIIDSSNPFSSIIAEVENLL